VFNALLNCVLFASLLGFSVFVAGPVVGQDNEGNAALGPAGLIPPPSHLTPEQQAQLAQDWWRSGDDLRILTDVEGLISLVTQELGCTRELMDLSYVTGVPDPLGAIQAVCNNDLNQSGLYVWLDEATGWMKVQ